MANRALAKPTRRSSATSQKKEDVKKAMKNELNSNENKTTLFHDGDCPLCKVEVKAMKKLDTANAIHWVDISKDKAALTAAGIDYKKAMARVHVQDENQQIQTGVRGFMEVWKHLPYYRRLSWLFTRVPFLLSIAEFFYSFFAKYRLKITGKEPFFTKRTTGNEQH